MWFMATRPYAKVACTAPTARQLADILWSELSKWLRKSVLAEEFVIQKDKIFQYENPKEWWCRAISPSVKSSKEEQAETLAGLHGDHLLIVVDEASGVPDPVYIPLEGALTQEDNKVILIGNMTKNKGYFYDTHFDPKIKQAWARHHWDSRKSSNVTKEMVEYFANKYGMDSNVFRIRVAGEPPLEDERTLISLAWAQQCIGTGVIPAEDEPLFLGVDVARYGDDKSIILPRKGFKIMPWETFQGLNTISLGGFVNTTYVEQEAEGLAIDEIGVGAGITDWLQKHGHVKTFGVNVSAQSTDPMKYHRLRDELWWRVRENCIKARYDFPDVDVNVGGTTINLAQTLCDELSSPMYDYDEKGAYIVESKKAMKLRGVESPNIADALCLTEYFAAFAHKLWKKPVDDKERRRRRLRRDNRGPDSWMAQ
jgi:hypothetical protein